MTERFEDICDNHNNTYLTYEDGEYTLTIGLNINHGISDIDFIGTLDEVLTLAENYDPYSLEE